MCQEGCVVNFYYIHTHNQNLIMHTKTLRNSYIRLGDCKWQIPDFYFKYYISEMVHYFAKRLQDKSGFCLFVCLTILPPYLLSLWVDHTRAGLTTKTSWATKTELDRERIRTAVVCGGIMGEEEIISRLGGKEWKGQGVVMEE